MEVEQFQEAQAIRDRISINESVLHDLRKVIYKIETESNPRISVNINLTECDLSYVLNKEDKQIVKDMLGYVKFSIENRIKELQDRFESL